MKRLFFALWPEDIIRQQCVDIGKAILTEHARLVRPANIHVTLLFLGNIDTDKEERFKQVLATVQVPSTTLCFNKLSFWKKPGILCLTTSNTYPGVETLVGMLSRLGGDLGIQTDERPFKPHVTLAKKATKLMPLEFDPINWNSSSFCLVESVNCPKGIEYRIVEEWGGK
jgi:RNA 2',3'-cyclic 3'-phosphodiesterase